jgi:site-specific DNA recombinase
MPTLAAIYCRISRDRTGQRLGVERQEPPCRELCARKGWEVAGVYVDDDTFAYSGKRRPQYERMLAEVQAGHVQAIVAWAADRLSRRPIENEGIIDLAERLGVQLATVTGEYDLATAAGRLHFRQLGILAWYESEHLAERFVLKHEELARGGRFHGGPRPFGYEKDGMTIRPAEAVEVARAAQRVLDGASLRSIATDWRARGVRSPQGKVWSPGSIGRLLTSPRLAGIRTHQGQLHDAAWPPILDKATHERLKVVLAGAVRRPQGGRGRPPEKALLPGLVFCAECGRRCYSTTKIPGKRSYACSRERGGCGRVSRLAETLEEFVRDGVLVALDSPEFTQARQARRSEQSGPQESGLLDALREDEARLVELGRDYANRLIARPAFFAAQQALTDRIAATTRTLDRITQGRILAALPAPSDGATLRATWDQADLEWRRSLVATLVEQVRLRPAVRGRNTFDPDRVEIIWRA